MGSVIAVVYGRASATDAYKTRTRRLLAWRDSPDGALGLDLRGFRTRQWKLVDRCIILGGRVVLSVSKSGLGRGRMWFPRGSSLLEVR